MYVAQSKSGIQQKYGIKKILYDQHWQYWLIAKKERKNKKKKRNKSYRIFAFYTDWIASKTLPIAFSIWIIVQATQRTMKALA